MLGEKGKCQPLEHEILEQRNLIIISNRGPFMINMDEMGELKYLRSGGGGLVTALLGLASQVQSTWIACAMTREDRAWREGNLPIADSGIDIRLRFITPDPEAYESYYGVISNPLLWFLQHSIWDFAHAPTINKTTWQAWEEGFVSVNRQFADAVLEEIQRSSQPSLIMLQDYHLYLAPRMIRQRLKRRRGNILTHFINIPWPEPEDWGLLPGRMREAILNGLCAVDLVGFQTQGDALNFIRTCETLLPGARVNYRQGRVILDHHVTHVRDFPISIDVQALQEQAVSEEVRQYRMQFEEQFAGQKLIMRIDRIEPSKNIIRGFQAYDEMLENHPEYKGLVQFVTILVPSRLEVEEYQDYLNEVMAAAGLVNARYGTSDWEPVRVLVGESYPRALAAMQLYDVLLVNPVADGMNLVAKEGPVVNERCGVVVLSERAGASQQLGKFALMIAPCDVSATAEALYQALIMPDEERSWRSEELRKRVKSEDIDLWLCWQMDALSNLLTIKQRDTRERT